MIFLELLLFIDAYFYFVFNFLGLGSVFNAQR